MKAPPDWDYVFRLLRERLSNSGEPVVSKAAKKRRDPFRILVSTVISLRTKDEVTGGASSRLWEKAQTPAQLSKMEEAEISKLIYPAGFYRIKAKYLKRIAMVLVESYDGRVPVEMEELLELPGVGRKTANLVRNLGFGLPGICVDTHVHRISNRLGWVATTNALQTERSLERVLPKRYWIPVNGLLVRFGQTICTPISPRCSACPFSSLCPRLGVLKFR